MLDGAVAPKALIKASAKMGFKALAVTDTCNLYCGVQLYKETKSQDMNGILGSEIWMWPQGISSLTPQTPDGGWHLVFLVENDAGYRNLSSLITSAIFDGMHYRPRIDFSLLEKHKEGLIVLTSGLNGPIGSPLRHGQPDLARENIERLGNIFDTDHLYLELQNYGLPLQSEMNDLSRSFAKEFGLKTVVTNDCRYLQPQDAVTLDVLNCIARGENIDNPNRTMPLTDQQYLKSEEEMRLIFPNDQEAIDRTGEIADRCHFAYNTSTYWFPATDPPDPNPPLPEGIRMNNKEYRADTQANWEYFYRAYPPPKSFNMPDPEKEAIPTAVPEAGNLCGYFEWYCDQGLKIRLRRVPQEEHEEYYKRLAYEIDIIEHMGFPAYMLIVAEFINWSKDNAIPVGPGRGSAAGSLVAYAMFITDIDPLRYGLLFERFLNPERVSMPDIDVDFCQDRREEAIQHVREKYGEELVSQIITYGKLQTKAAVKDIARTLGINFMMSNDIAKLIPEEKNINIPMARQDPTITALTNVNPLVNRVFSLAQRVEGMTRQTGIHAAGVVIADRPLVYHAPLYRDGPEGGPVVQYDMKSAEGIGLIKFDFLGLKTLDQIRDALHMIERNTGEAIDISAIDLEDEAVYSMLTAGDSQGVFQVESDGMQTLLKRLKPSNIDEVIALIALYRPGPLSSGMVDTYIRVKHEKQDPDYLHPLLEDLLKSTYGTIVYQEQVMQIAQILASYSLGEADLLRRAMGKKNVEEMDRQKIRFRDGAVKNGIDAKKAEEIFDLMAFFAGYGFNKSHSAAYGMVAYQTAWLKAHHRAEYMAALMSIDANNTDKLIAYINDCKKGDIEILFPDVNHSYGYFDVPKENRKQIRYGLSAIKGAGSAAIQSIIDAREEKEEKRFTDFMDFLESINYRVVNKKVLENLIKCGALDWTELPRRTMMTALPNAILEAQRVQRDIESGQTSLFSMFSDPDEVPKYTIPDNGEWGTAPKMVQEKSALGFCLTGNPLDAYRDVEKKLGYSLAYEAEEAAANTSVILLGNIASCRIMTNKRGAEMAILTLQCRDRTIDAMFFGEQYQNAKRNLFSKTAIALYGVVEKRKPSEDDDFEKTTIKGDRIIELAEIRELQSTKVFIHLKEKDLKKDKVKHLAEMLEEAPPGKCTVEVSIQYPQKGTVHLNSPYKIKPTEELLNSFEETFGRANVWSIL